MTDNPLSMERTEAGATQHKWGALASFLMPVASIISAGTYLAGNLREAMGPFSYALADFLYGPVWAASLVTVVFALREHLGGRAPRRMSLALFAAFVAAGAFVAVACIRAANRHYHLIHPELHLENSLEILTVWTTLVAGMTGTAWHFMGWTMALVGSAGWTSRGLPRLLSALYLLAGTQALFVYVLPEFEGSAMAFSIIVSIWQGILLWKAGPQAAQVPDPA